MWLVGKMSSLERAGIHFLLELYYQGSILWKNTLFNYRTRFRLGQHNRHGADSTKEKRVVLKEYHFYISDDRCHDLTFVQHNFQLFYKHLEDNNIQMEQHWIWSDGCAGKFKNSRVFQ